MWAKGRNAAEKSVARKRLKEMRDPENQRK
jgi:hypothetical protein